VEQATHNKIVSFIWGIADDVLRDLFKRGKYPDVILPMCVIRRMDAVLEPTKQAGRIQFVCSWMFALSACRPFRKIFELLSRPLIVLLPTSAHSRN
jgi:hypothetical protein